MNQNQQRQMMAQMQKMQTEMAKAQEELASTVVMGTAGGNAVTIEMTCDFQMRGVKIAKEAVDPDDVETLEDLVTVAINDAIAKAQEASGKRMGAVTGGMKIPGLM